MKRSILTTSILALLGTSVVPAYSAAPPVFLNFSRPEIKHKDTRAYNLLSVNSPFTITLNFSGELTESQKEAFRQAKAAWESRLTGYQC